MSFSALQYFKQYSKYRKKQADQIIIIQGFLFFTHFNRNEVEALLSTINGSLGHESLGRF